MANNLDFSQKTSAGPPSNSLDFSDRVTENTTKGLMSRQLDVVTTNVPASAYSMISNKIGVDQNTWDIYRNEIAGIESKGLGDYSAKGGHNNHYDGRYQMGKLAKEDAATLLGYSLKHDSKSRQSFRNDKVKQEEAFAAFTVKNHNYLMSKSKKYKELSLQEKLSALAYAHNQGWSGANKWLKTGEVGSDAFGTKGTKYSNAITKALAKIEAN